MGDQIQIPLVVITSFFFFLPFRSGHSKTQTMQTADCKLQTVQTVQTVQTEYFFLILVIAYTLDLHFFVSRHKIEFNYMSECLLYVTIYRRATQARYMTV